MIRTRRFALLFCLLAGCGLAQGKEGGDSNLLMWNWANFLVLTAALGYVVVKMVPPLYAARSRAILKDMTESEKIRQDAEARAADVERRLAGLETEIAALRARSLEESQLETERLAAHTAAEIAKIQAQSQRDIATATKTARTELKRYAAGLAIGLAEQKIRRHMSPAAEDGLVSSFVHDLK